MPKANVRDVNKRFWKHVKKQPGDGCWLWTAYSFFPEPTKKYGPYGMFYYKGSSVLAHRMSWELAYGEIPKAHAIRQRCGQSLCIRPEHLLCVHKGNAVQMTLEEKRECWDIYRAGGVSQAALARAAEVSYTTMNRLLKGGRPS